MRWYAKQISIFKKRKNIFYDKMETSDNLHKVEITSPQQDRVTSGDVKLGVQPLVILSNR